MVITLDEEVPDVRPGFTCTAEITTATRKNVTSVPIQALTVREMLFDTKGAIVREEPQRAPPRRRVETTTVGRPTSRRPDTRARRPKACSSLRDGRAVFTPVKIGIAGEQYFEVLEGLKTGDQVITGPFASVRELADGERSRSQQSAQREPATGHDDAQ